jgi:hypothetical protein
MEYNEILEKLGYCGLHCGKCFAFTKGPIKENALKLKESLGNFEVYAQRFSGMLSEPSFDHYPEFKALLQVFSSENCRGCRVEGCKIFKSCLVRDCAINEKVDFCFECKKFPCDNTGFDEHLKKRWININSEMKEIGVEAYYDKIKDLPRY